MDEGKFAADFLAKNLEKILALAKKGLSTLDEVVQVGLKTAYTDYICATREKYSKAKSFFIRHESVDLYTYYVPIGIACGRKRFSSPSFREVSSHSKRIVITGSGGSGKSILIKHLFLDCIADCVYAPVLIELRDLNSDGKSLDGCIDQALDTFGFDVSGDYIRRAKQAGHFCFFFDGYDEINPSNKRKLMDQISALSKKYRDCPIIISSRPDDVFNGIEDFSIFQILALDSKSAVTLVEKLPYDATIKSKFCHDLENGLFETHKSFLSNPLLLSIMLLTYGENAEIPSKLSIFYNQAYEALFQRHDANKGGFSRGRLTPLDIQDFSRVFSLFALQTYERRLLKMPRTTCISFIEQAGTALKKDFKAEHYLEDLISAACLLFEDGLEIAFSHRSFQEYFVALHISSALPEVQKALIDRYWRHMRSDNVMELLLEITPDLVEKFLLLPRLEALFNDIGVKRSVGITHWARYFKKEYKKLDVDRESVRATFRNEGCDLGAVLQMAVKHVKNYEFASRRTLDEFRLGFFDKYGKEGDEAEYNLDGLTHRSPLLYDLSQSPGIFSLKFLAAGYEAYKQLKIKHSETVQNLEVLLGIRQR